MAAAHFKGHVVYEMAVKIVKVALNSCWEFIIIISNSDVIYIEDEN
jgi:hypothetical protein